MIEKKQIYNKWILKIKKNKIQNEIENPQNYEQKFVIDYYDIIINLFINVKMITTLVAKKMIHMIIIDIKIAVIHGDLKKKT